MLPEATIRINTHPNETLAVFKIVFDFSYKWDFIYNGFKISAKIADEVFQEKVKRGEPFANGDTLQVELEIQQEFDHTIEVWENKIYTIKKVIGHIPRARQGDLGL